MKTVLALLFCVTGLVGFAGEGYKIGAVVAPDFKLKNTDGKMVGLSDFSTAKGFIVVFTCNACPYAQAYQERLVALDKQFKQQGYPVIAINPNDPAVVPAESFDKMVEVAKNKKFSFPYLYDEKNLVYRDFGATNTPHVFVLQKTSQGFVVKYTGAIDNNYQDASKVTEPYLENAVNALLKGNNPVPQTTKAIGCGVKSKA